jgi:hypothetical protein
VSRKTEKMALGWGVAAEAQSKKRSIGKHNKIFYKGDSKLVGTTQGG